MNTRILRMSQRSKLGRCCRVVGLGQMQPVLISAHEFRAEGVAGRFGQETPCWMVLSLPTHKLAAKKLFAELEAHKAAGTETPASRVWREYNERKAA